MKSIFPYLLVSMSPFVCFADKGQDEAIHAIQTNPNPTVRFGTKSKNNIFLTGEIIWFKPLTTNFEVVIDSATVNPQNYVFFENRFKPGVRLNLGYNINYDGWDLILGYTGLRYKHNATSEYNAGSGSLFRGPLNYVYYFDQADLNLGRLYKISPSLKMRPNIGIRSLWLTQKNHQMLYNVATGSGPSSDLTRYKGFLVGMTAAVDSLFKITRTLSIYTNLGMSALANQQKALNSNVSTSFNATFSKTTYGTKIIDGLDFAIGMQWDQNFSQNNYHINFHAGYEHHSLLNLNTEAYNSVNSLSKTQFLDSDFTLQGLVLGMRFDF